MIERRGEYKKYEERKERLRKLNNTGAEIASLYSKELEDSPRIQALVDLAKSKRLEALYLAGWAEFKGNITKHENLVQIKKLKSTKYSRAYEEADGYYQVKYLPNTDKIFRDLNPGEKTLLFYILCLDEAFKTKIRASKARMSKGWRNYQE